ncbi:hypothetical protein ES288_A07G062400v1 [Gossypium darwinii]|uniref:AMP-binding enzyme C-terminal domain-containing protein n=1 Tax=Gossypium darwinii TaxID=34276 RepID=A0A5D2FSR2_GOSDA|nr:hypothetical protein ES288_A07G062400v1 [Gossypium darwinii]
MIQVKKRRKPRQKSRRKGKAKASRRDLGELIQCHSEVTTKALQEWVGENVTGRSSKPVTIAPNASDEGYVRDEKATAEILDSEGWLKTGDICYFDSEGFLYVVDRLKELIKYKAYQVPPAELEHLLHSHPEIVDAAVVPYPDEEAGQIPMAYVVKNPGSNITEAQIMDFIAEQARKTVAPYQKIRRVAFITSITRTPAGKILRRKLINHSLSHGLSKL